MDDKVRFLQEAAIMAQFNHTNIIKMHGVVIEEEPVRSYLACDLHVTGSLLNAVYDHPRAFAKGRSKATSHLTEVSHLYIY